MENDALRVMGPEHPMFGASMASYVFGVFSPDSPEIKLMFVTAENEMAINMLESLVANDGSVSNTCAVMSSCPGEMQIRSSAIERIAYTSFILDIVDVNRWIDSPFLAGLFVQSLSGVERATALLKINRELRRANRNTQSTTAPDENKLNEVQSGLIGLGFKKPHVQAFIASIRDKSGQSAQQLLLEGIQTLNQRAS